MRFITTAVYLLALAFSVDACKPSAATITSTTTPGQSYPSFGYFTAAQTQSHFAQQFDTVSYYKDGTTMLACVDARMDGPVIGTPGGDLAEVVTGISSYFKVMNITATETAIADLVSDFVKTRVTKFRPFYFHTDDAKLQLAFAAIGAKVGRTITNFPVYGPPESEKSIWLDELSQSYSQGCGHIRLMIANFSLYGLDSNLIPRATIRAYFSEYWSADASGKLKFSFESRLGSLVGEAVTVVSNSGRCSGYSPAFSPNFLSSTVFIYHPASAKAFREGSLTEYFSYKSGRRLNRTTFQSAANALHNTQLVATLTYLSPANAINIYGVTITTKR